MPTLSWPDGSTLTWGDAPPAAPDCAPPPIDAATAALPPEPPPSGTSVTEADVQSALARVPPKWSATAWRFAKTLGAALAAAFVVTGGTIEGVLKDPTAFLTALGAAVVMAVQKFISWKDEA